MMKTFLKIKKIPFLLLVVLGLISINRVWADETKTAEIKLSFHAQDSLKTCHALVMSEGKPLANVAVKFYAKRLYSLSAARDKAPTVLIIVSNIIITVIWGVIAYVVVQVFRIRKSSSRIKNKTITN